MRLNGKGRLISRVLVRYHLADFSRGLNFQVELYTAISPQEWVRAHNHSPAALKFRKLRMVKSLEKATSKGFGTYLTVPFVENLLPQLVFQLNQTYISV
jgi:hypothetical protein